MSKSSEENLHGKTKTQMNEEQTSAVAIRDSNTAISHALGVNDLLDQVKLIQDVMKRVMDENVHYGKIPGCGDKATLLQPGAQKLTMTFRLAPEYHLQETDLARGHKEYRVICTLKSIQSGNFVGQGVGCCSTMESKYRYRGGARKCPTCGKETIIKGKAEYGGGWLCFAKKGGCGAKWPDGALIIEGQSIERVEHDNPADFYNTVLKMAKKRAFVDATITATAASDIFTQDIGDDESNGNDNGDAQDAPGQQPATPTPSASKNAPTVPTRAKEQAPKQATEATKAWFLNELRYFDHDLLLEYAVKNGVLLPTEDLNDWPLTKVPTDREQLRKIMLQIEQFRDGGSPPEPEDNVPFDADEWRHFPMPFGKNAGTKLEDLDKKYLFGLWANYTVEKEFNGKPKSETQIQKDRQFRAYLDDAGKHYEFTKND